MAKEMEKRILKLVDKAVGEKFDHSGDPKPPICAIFFHQPVAVRKNKKPTK